MRHIGSSDWDAFSSTSRCWRLLDGIVNVDEIDCSARGFKGMTVRTLYRAQRTWSLQWVNSTKGALEPPVRGRFDGSRGEFYGLDLDGSRPVLCRFIWTADVRSPRWEQAFSTDRGASWETNWIMAFTRKTTD